MTNDYKQDILDYITNNVNETPGSNVPQFPQEDTIQGNVYNDLANLIPDVSNYFVLGSIFNENSQNTLFYGYYSDTSSNFYGFIYIVDENMEEIQLITTFTSGTKLFPIIAMNQDENGYMYALSNELGGTPKGRVLLFNNILVTINGTYVARLRASYIIPNSTNYNYQLYDKNKILKTPDEATYFILTRIGNQNYTTIIEFRINVGEENEWFYYDLDQLYSLARYSSLIEKEGEKTRYYLYALSQVSTPTTYVEYVLENKVLKKTKTISLGELATFTSSQVLAINSSNIYISYYSNTDEKTKLLKVNGSQLEEITSIVNPTPLVDQRLSLELIGNILFAKLFYQESGNNKTKLGIIQGNTIYFTNAYERISGNSSWNYVLTTINVTYNLVKMYIPTSTITNKFSFDYNPLNYNGLEYEGYNQTLATKGRLYSSGELVFARNLYNTTLLGNIATSNLQVPNTLLNNETIVIEDLVGATNGIILHNATTVTKNIYETLYVNFIRALNVLDDDEGKQYPTTAVYINENINTATKQNCEESFIGKVRINYENNSVIQNINWTYNTDHYETSFVVDATNEVPTIDFMSNDETTIYVSKELDITTGNYYVVSQKIRIE